MNVSTLSGRLVLATRATPAVLAFVPLLEGRRSWLKGGGLSIEDTPHNRSAIENHFGVKVESATPAPELFDVAPLALKHTFARKPEEHQLTALKAIGNNPNFALFMEQGTGKTKVGIDWACMLFTAGVIEAVLVISKAGVHRQWVEAECPKDMSVPWVGGFWRGKPIDDALLLNGSDKLKVWSINYDSVKTPRGFVQAEAFCLVHSGKLLIICDESQEIKNSRSQRYKAVERLKPYSARRMIGTGTPIAKDLTDEWAQLMWLDETIIGCKYITTFRARYCIMGGFEGRSVIGHKNMTDFRSKADPFSFRVTKEQIGILPKRYTEWTFDVTKEQRSLIKQVKDELLASLESGTEVSIKEGASAFSKLQQIACGFIIDTEQQVAHRIMPTERNPRAQAMVEWVRGGEGKAIVWSCFREDKLIIAEALAAAGISYVEYHGAIGSDGREAAVRSFMDPDGAQVLIAGSSASTGLNLQGLCNRALYYSNSFNAITRWQSEDRIHRMGTVGACVFTDLIGIGSTDRHIRRNLAKKEGISRMSLDEIVDAVRDLP